MKRRTAVLMVCGDFNSTAAVEIGTHTVTTTFLERQRDGLCYGNRAEDKAPV
jgi:hypothetical protein